MDTAASRAALPSPTSACWVFLCLCNPPLLFSVFISFVTPTPLRINVYVLSHFCSFLLPFFLSFFFSTYIYIFWGQRVVPETSFISHFPGPTSQDCFFQVIFFSILLLKVLLELHCVLMFSIFKLFLFFCKLKHFWSKVYRFEDIAV